MKRFLRNISFIILPLLIIIPLVNHSVDPGHVYGGYEQEVASLLQNHRYVTNTNPNLECRRLKKSMIDSCKRDVDLLILGSSSVMMISEDMFKNRHVLNIGVSGAAFTDIASFLYYYLQHHSAPKTIIIGVDPQHFNGNFVDPRWRVVKQAYIDFCHNVLHETPPPTNPFDKWSNLYSLSYFQESVKVFLWQKGMEIFNNWDFSLHTTNHEIQAADVAQGVAVCYDGSYVFWSDEEFLPPSERKIVPNFKPIYIWMYDELSNREIEHWHKLIQFIQQKNIKCYLFTTAYHPVLYKRAMTDNQYEGAKAAMEYVNMLSEEYNVQVIGDYNPATYGLTESDFHDGFHMHRIIYRHILENAEIE